jgi:hypothetical protein
VSQKRSAEDRPDFLDANSWCRKDLAKPHIPGGEGGWRQGCSDENEQRAASGGALARPARTHELRNEMHISSEMALDRPSSHSWFLPGDGISPTLPASKRCD